jgi:hypothetical protein
MVLEIETIPCVVELGSHTIILFRNHFPGSKVASRAYCNLTLSSEIRNALFSMPQDNFNAYFNDSKGLHGIAFFANRNCIGK